MLDDGAGQLMGVAGRLGHGLAGQPGGEITGAEGVAGRGRVDHARLGQGHGRHLAALRLADDEAGLGAALDDDLVHAEGPGPGQALVFIAVAPERHVVIQGQEGEIGQGQHGAIGLLRGFPALPQARAIVVVKGDPDAGGAAVGQQSQQGQPVIR